MAKAVIDPEKCRSCGCCVRACPGGIIIFTKTAEVAPGCSACGACAAACPFEAISIENND
ncbi:MAG: 4Fe-4S dicluster domain-containing protein [Ruminococcaceae bacterium]|nr:4Fe-4S dicluster domain-containing protein [Oscillospiraceae bacterium]